MKFPSKKQIADILSGVKRKHKAINKTNRRLILVFAKWLGIFLLLIGIVTTLDAIQKSKNKVWIIEVLSTELPLFNNVEALAIIAGLIALALDTPNQQKKSHYEAWQVIALSKGDSGSGGRIQALQDLAEDEVSLAGVSVENAFLEKIKLPGADLFAANFQNSKLWKSNFSYADLRNAKFIGAILAEANLSDANLTGAILAEANLSDANLTGAIFWDKQFGELDKEAKNITPSQIKQAKNWEKAIYSPQFRKKLGLPPEE